MVWYGMSLETDKQNSQFTESLDMHGLNGSQEKLKKGIEPCQVSRFYESFMKHIREEALQIRHYSCVFKTQSEQF